MKYFLLLITLLFNQAIAGTTMNQNDAFLDLSAMLTEDKERPTFMIETVDPKSLDFSVESLKVINSYLEKVRTTEGFQQHGNIVVLRTGAYVGEVLRRNSKKTKWDWLDFDQAAQKNPEMVKSLGKSIGTAAVLNDGSDGFVFPLAKVYKYLVNGSEDDLYFYAQAIVEK